MDGLTLLRRAGEAGLAVKAENDKLVIRGPKHAEPVARLLIENKSAIMAALTDWHARHREALAYWGVLHPATDAARLAWGEMENRWHRVHGTRVLPWRCAGCGRLIGGLAVLDLADGNRGTSTGSIALRCTANIGEARQQRHLSQWACTGRRRMTSDEERCGCHRRCRRVAQRLAQLGASFPWIGRRSESVGPKRQLARFCRSGTPADACRWAPPRCASISESAPGSPQA
jgi:hypothetical protein